MSDSRIIKQLASPRLAAWLIAILIGMQLAAVLIPQRSFLGETYDRFAEESPGIARAIEAVGLDAVFGGWLIAIVSVLLIANVTVCTYQRARKWRSPRVPGLGAKAITTRLEDDGAEAFLASADARVRSEGWSVADRTGDGVLARKGQWGFLGSLLMHLAILVIIAGGALTALTSFRGEIVLAEGQEVVDAPENYVAITDEPEFGEGFSGARVGLDSMDVVYEGDIITSAVAGMHGIDTSGAVVRKDVSVNHPLDVAGKSYLLRDTGYAVTAVIARPGESGEPVIVSLAEDIDIGWADTIDLDGGDDQTRTLQLTATPEEPVEGAAASIRRYALEDPHLEVAVLRGGEAVTTTVLARGESVEFDDGTTLLFEELRLWNKYLVRGEPARWITYVGFWMAVIGAGVRFTVPERRMVVRVREGEQGPEAAVAVRSRPWRGIHAVADEALRDEILTAGASETDEGAA